MIRVRVRIRIRVRIGVGVGDSIRVGDSVRVRRVTQTYIYRNLSFRLGLYRLGLNVA